jgi:uncharacterized protein
VHTFEEAFAKEVGARHAVAVCNATAAIHLAMLVGSGAPSGHQPHHLFGQRQRCRLCGCHPGFC